jgi:cobalt-zinc-cadmium efflux system membrane fusion protein
MDPLMKRKNFEIGLLILSIPALLDLGGCGGPHGDIVAQEAPPAATVVPALDSSLFAVEHPEQYPLATATPHEAASQLIVTGTVNPDIARTVPVVTLASGRIVDIRARLGDTVQKGQLLLRVRSDDVSGGYDGYRKAVSDELLARKQLERSKDLYAHGAIAASDLEIAQDAEDDAKVTLETTAEHLRLLGNDPDNPSGLVDIFAPISGVITDQQVTNAASIQSFSANPFTISDLSYVWIVCDVYENDIPNLQMGETADIRLNAYPGQVLKGTISNIGAILDPAIRTAKVRLEVRNPGLMRVGMFATATFYGLKKETHTAVPASAIVHLHDRDWIYTPTQDQKFRRQEVSAGEMLPNQMQEILSGLQPNQRVVTNALALQNAIDNE